MAVAIAGFCMLIKLANYSSYLGSNFPPGNAYMDPYDFMDSYIKKSKLFFQASKSGSHRTN